MFPLAPATLWFAPRQVFVAAEVHPMPPELIEEKVTQRWWTDPALKPPAGPPPIDRAWDWNRVAIDYNDRLLPAEKVGILTGDGEVQGAMLISTQAVPSRSQFGASALFVELLFTAPRNRLELRADGAAYFCGVGTELLRWAARFSIQRGCGGRLMLDGSPDAVAWYEKRGLRRIPSAPIVFEGVTYAPMELPLEGVAQLLDPGAQPTAARTTTTRTADAGQANRQSETQGQGQGEVAAPPAIAA